MTYVGHRDVGSKMSVKLAILNSGSQKPDLGVDGRIEPLENLSNIVVGL